MKNNNVYWVCILRCENDSLYTGYTSDLVRRYKEHLEGSAKSKYTRSFKPICIAQYWKIEGSKSLALQVEKYIKKLSKKNKTELLQEPFFLTEKFGKEVIVSNLVEPLVFG